MASLDYLFDCLQQSGSVFDQGISSASLSSGTLFLGYQLQQKVVEFIKNADLYMDNFEYVDMDKIQLKTGECEEKPDEKVLDIPENIMDQIRLVSTYKGVHVPSMMFDSTGTKKIAAIVIFK